MLYKELFNKFIRLFNLSRLWYLVSVPFKSKEYCPCGEELYNGVCPLDDLFPYEEDQYH